MDNNIARFINNSNASEQGKTIDKSSEELSFQNKLIDNLNGPAILTDESLNIIHQNIYSENLVQAFQNRNPIIHGIIIRCMTNDCPENQKFSIEDETETRHYDLFAFPVNISKNSKKPFVLLFGKDTTVEQHLTKALVESRQMFKDLVSCSTDFAWETDNKGRFNYVSSNGILGYSAYELNEKKAADLIVGADGLNPFDTLDAINDVEIWLQRSDGEFACVQVSANPIIDNNSTWQGARGVCRDVTEVREREASLRRIRKNEQVLKRIISTIRDEIDPTRMLHTTAKAALDGLSAKHCHIASLSKNSEDKFEAKLKADAGGINNGDFIDKLISKALNICNDRSKPMPPSYVEQAIDGKQTLIGFTKHHNEINGAIFVTVQEENKKWNKDEKSLFIGVSSHLGIAFEQIKNYEKLEELSKTDELTSLLNRRAFTEMANKRLVIQKRQRQNCALLYIDLDNFKQVNDTYGHAVGDDVLVTLSSILKRTTRTEDLCCRLGGDEFAVWLENVDEKSAVHLANRILECTTELQKLAENDTNPVSLSIGIAISDAKSNYALETLMEHADNALYDVKKNGKSGIVLNQ
jgi:diguanylate cyclase (GGDEF)-like protein/PAS domain S-box-containing protein